MSNQPECAGCGADSLWVVWDKAVCNECKCAWDDDAPHDDAWDEKYPEAKHRYVAKTAWTAKWCEKRRARAA